MAVLFGWFSAIGIHLMMVAAFCALFGLNIAIRKRLGIYRGQNEIKKIIIKMAVFLVILEIIFLFYAPLKTLIPYFVLENTNVIRPIGNECNQLDLSEQAKKFFGDTVNFSNVNIVYGGMPSNIKLLHKVGLFKEFSISALVLGNDVFIKSPQTCLKVDTYVHEFTHLWQVQHGTHSGIRAIKPLIVEQIYYQLTDRQRIYVFGGKAGLLTARTQKNNFLDFGIEQQAMIVQNYFLATVLSAKYDFYGEKITPDYIEILRYYATQTGIQ